MKVDKLGRIYISSEIRKQLNIKEDTLLKMEINKQGNIEISKGDDKELTPYQALEILKKAYYSSLSDSDLSLLVGDVLNRVS